MTTDGMNDPVTPATGEPQRRLPLEFLPAGREEGAQADGGKTTDLPGTACRRFIPTNREDLLLQLSSLAISRDFPTGMTVVPVQADMLAVLPDGLRAEEVSLLQAGRVQRFPVLVELREPTGEARAVFGISEVAALYFRSQREADDFRFRPVDEFDTEAMSCRVDPERFGLPGAARFSNGPQGQVQMQDRGRFADRIAGGLCSLFELGATSRSCWPDIAGLLCGPGVPGPHQDVTLSGALLWEAAPARNGTHASAVLRAFIAHASGERAGALVSKVHAHLTDGTEDAVEVRKAERWFAMANAVLENRVRLDGDLLSDDGSVALRAALLACVAGDVGALIPFMHASRPAGRRVIVAAAFLIGLRTGVTDMPWTMKRGHLGVLPPMIVALQKTAPEAGASVDMGFRIEPDEMPTGVVLRLLWNDQEIACWQPFEAEEPRSDAPARYGDAEGDADSVTEPHLAAQSGEAGSAGAPLGSDNGVLESGGVNFIRSPEGRSIELLRPELPRQRGATMKCTLTEDDRLRKPKEILEAASARGLLWRVGVTPEGVAALYMDLPDWPNDTLQEELSGTLEEALDSYLVKKKPRATAASPRRRKTAVTKSGADAAPTPAVNQAGDE